MPFEITKTQLPVVGGTTRDQTPTSSNSVNSSNYFVSANNYYNDNEISTESKPNEEEEEEEAKDLKPDHETSTIIELKSVDEPDAKRRREHFKNNKSKSLFGDNINNWSDNRNVAEGLMDIALLSANANQLRFLITYNYEASTYYISLGLIILSLALQVSVGIALIFKRRMRNNSYTKGYIRLNECLISGVFMVTVVNILLAAFTTTDGGTTKSIANSKSGN